ncbi:MULTISPECIES: MXAN_5187 C-terminal domain-containing protein [Syntrophotalea]|jgi:hypothetical protein|uniref:Uncharacterized protein n=1 Tax=Syntrophotalea acetylenica TaxID=29542 RepID=A0A1L3GG76_SYNAC|nr:MXAN_5187 C-terminal domain-containing protein [Syntrophotalea acetylenica]APG24952.1 hypothetical protein A7E75_07910 [Syntrophotalea acetylenica]APG43017.1 hypothetical protein A6070_01870 [Syntrophotalea acetylenica]MDY0261070.1 MXAN_5187 C-terminal domain-containing protein [Syntrophotalea acetylenica]
MDERRVFKKKLDDIALELRELELLYERYFSGEEKREPLKQRTEIERKLRALATRRIIKTDHRFLFDSLSSRYHTYATQWNRIQRLIDEGKYHRHTERRPAKTAADPAKALPSDDLYENLLRAHQSCALKTPPPGRSQFDAYLEKQKAQILEKYGKQNVEFRIVIENGKPKLRAKAK